MGTIVEVTVGYAFIAFMVTTIMGTIITIFWVFMMTRWKPIMDFRRKYIQTEYEKHEKCAGYCEAEEK